MDSDRWTALLADAVATEAAQHRTKERMLRQAAEEEATFVGTLLELGEAQARVAVRTASGRVHRGVVSAVARDFAILGDDHGRDLIVAIRAVVSVRTAIGDRDAPTGAREAPINASMAAVLGRLAADRPLVQLGVVGDDALLLGTLRSVGADVVRIVLGTADRAEVVLPLTAVTEVVLLED